MPYDQPDPNVDKLRIHPTIFLGGFLLSCLAGFINVTMLSAFSVPVSHMSGAVSRLSIQIGAGAMQDVATIASLIMSFVAGAMLTGYVIRVTTLANSWRYVVILTCETVVLTVASLLVSDRSMTDSHVPILLTAAACGMQNAMASSYYGLIIRTTHVTGILTDLGFMIGAYLRTREVKIWKLALLVLLVLGYFSGGLASVLLQQSYHIQALYGSACLSFCILMGYIGMRYTSGAHDGAPGSEAGR